MIVEAKIDRRAARNDDELSVSAKRCDTTTRTRHRSSEPSSAATTSVDERRFFKFDDDHDDAADDGGLVVDANRCGSLADAVGKVVGDIVASVLFGDTRRD